jgi:hypothetical protein
MCNEEGCNGGALQAEARRQTKKRQVSLVIRKSEERVWLKMDQPVFP